MTSWNRRVAAASRVRGHLDPEGLGERLEAFGLPAGLHPDDAVSVLGLLRIAEGRTQGFSTTVLGRVFDDPENYDTGAPLRLVRIVVMGNERGATVLVGDAEDDLPVDSITGLPGRDHLLRSIDDAIATTLGTAVSVAVFSIDVDRFKAVNDRRGFQAGDEVLRALAVRLEDVLRPDDVLTRLDGDEFSIVCPDVLGVAEATSLGERFRTLCAHESVDSPLNGLTVSVGIAVGVADRSAEDLVREAETALHQAKGMGRDRCVLFDDDLRHRAERRHSVDQRLRSALDDDAIRVHFQPIVDLAADHRIIGCEALLRIEGEAGGHLDPRELIGAAEDAGLIRRLEETVMKRAAATVRILPDVGDEPRFVSINISDGRLHDSRFPLTLARTLHNAELPAEQVHLELHPNVLEHHGPGVRLITQLRALGVCVVIDGFHDGTALNRLEPELVDIVKLDQRIVHGIGQDRGTERADLLISGLRDRDLHVCAVGVESQAQLDVVRDLGCRSAQGYFFAPPVDPARLGELVARSGS